ncbi:elongation factor-1 alpha [Candidatus Methylospira mobilis]|uniref:elongation factor-1 alpha n=1 Tax=Candidatus Methylospira mobilis TaxID=1808979 RepID=UPI0028EA2075|nr:elongation factor-1 alpha [Candidatus Methylospira mobilis]WNV03887.1 elongation factor-1 alpha [Candidatus Methylospira mobilis]
MPINLSNVSLPVKLLFSGYLMIIAIGYGMATIQILVTHGMADGKFGLSIQDIVYSYYGNRSGSHLESKLNGSMKANAPEQDRFALIQWVRSGAGERDYLDHAKAIFDTRCVPCHNADAGGLPDFSRLDNINKYTHPDSGATLASLARVSHIHLFGIVFIFMFVGGIFSLTSGVPLAIKCTSIVTPFVFLLLDIASWWLTKLNPHFAWLVILGGAGLAMAFVFMWVVSMYEMWVLPRYLRR